MVWIVVATACLQTIIQVSHCIVNIVRLFSSSHPICFCSRVYFADQGCLELKLLIISEPIAKSVPNQANKATNKAHNYVKGCDGPLCVLVLPGLDKASSE